MTLALFYGGYFWGLEGLLGVFGSGSFGPAVSLCSPLFGGSAAGLSIAATGALAPGIPGCSSASAGAAAGSFARSPLANKDGSAVAEHDALATDLLLWLAFRLELKDLYKGPMGVLSQKLKPRRGSHSPSGHFYRHGQDCYLATLPQN